MSALHAESAGRDGLRAYLGRHQGVRRAVPRRTLPAQENPLTNTFHFGVQKLHRYITLTGHFFGSSALICNAKLYESWPQDVQRAVRHGRAGGDRYQHKLAAEEDDTILAQIDPKENDLIR
jgi:TRAP-type C4-dicarboxylate transport system substrate-binding protein